MLYPGLCEQVINRKPGSELAVISEAREAVAPIDRAEAPQVLAQHLSEVVQRVWITCSTTAESSPRPAVRVRV
jgi:hypothetical protein